MIVDSFMFFNELDLLEIRLNELENVVDRFVLVEATRTHSNHPKPLTFNENRLRFSRFLDRIEHVVVDNAPQSTDAWALERFQRDATVRGLHGLPANTLIMVSDVDEIPRDSAVRQAALLLSDSSGPAAALTAALRLPLVTRAGRSLLKRHHPAVIVFELTPAIYHYNRVSVRRKFRATRMTRLRDLGRPRDLRRWGGRVVEDAGWHFTCIGGVADIQAKIKAFAHQEYNTPGVLDPENIRDYVDRGEYLFQQSSGADEFRCVPLDATFPTFLRLNAERFRAGICTEIQEEPSASRSSGTTF